MPTKELVLYLRSAPAVRGECEALYAACAADRLAHFRLAPEKLPAVADYVLAEIRAVYPTLAIPFHSRWRHFDEPRLTRLTAALSGRTPEEATRSRVELAIVSVLLDAGAGTAWRYQDAATGRELARSEGLAIASAEMFLDGAFSSDPDYPAQADAGGLKGIDKRALAAGFQAGAKNQLVGLDGRLGMLHRLAHAVQAHPKIFGDIEPRLGNLYDYLAAHAGNGKLPAAKILGAILDGLGSIWPGRLVASGVNLGDVWSHPALAQAGPGGGMVPFHKLSQWLAYSLIEPLEDAGLEIGGLDQLTGLAEYRNGGLFVDLGALVPKHAGVTGQAHPPGSEVIVEWRALTVALLDRTATLLREALNMSAFELPLVKVLQGGTWAAGRKIAAALRPDGGPPIRLASDGTVF